MTPALHRIILVVDVAGFGDRLRTNQHRLVVRRGLYAALQKAYRDSGIPWESCHREDRGDGTLVLAPSEVAKSLFTETLPDALRTVLRRYNRSHSAPEQVRLRVALHAGEVHFGEHGVSGSAVDLAYRLLDAPPLKAALDATSAAVALIVSSRFYDEVVRHSPDSEPAAFRQIRFAVREIMTTGWIRLPGEPHPPAPPDVVSGNSVVPRRLPTRIPHFAGRQAQLGELAALLEGLPIATIDGTAGIGKTALALHWAHRNTDRFPDGQLYVDLRGFDPTSTPMPPAEAVRGFLDAFGVPPETIPANPHAQTALYRSLVATRRVLIVLDNAKDAEQVRPLLPGGSTSRVVVTSRDRLTSLVSGEGARPVTLPVLPDREAVALMTTRLGVDRIAAEPAAAGELIGRCARLPLALAIMAASAGSDPPVPLRELADELADEQDRLDVLDTGDPRAVFSCSYRTLSGPAARLFRQLGVCPGPDISLPAAASLAGVGVPGARTLLTELTRAHLVEEHASGRYRCHGLLRSYAAEQAVRDEPDRHLAVRRALDHYLHTGFGASLVLEPRGLPIRLATAAEGVTVRSFTSRAEASAWFVAEHANIVAAIDRAAAAGPPAHAWQLPWTFATFLNRHGHWHDSVATLRTALAATGRLGDQGARGTTHRLLGNSHLRLDEPVEAITQYQEAIAIFRRLGNSEGQACAHYSLAVALDRQDRCAEALAHAQHALGFYRTTDNRASEVRTISSIGWYQARLGHYDQALAQSCAALAQLRVLGDHEGAADTLTNLGYARSRLGQHDAAIADLRQAVALWRQSASHFEEADTLAQLGDTHHAAGDGPSAREAWRQALVIFDNLHHANAERLRVKLNVDM